MPLDPQLQALRDQWARAGAPPLYTLSLAEARAADLARIQAGSGDPEPVARVTERTLPGPGGPLPARIYEPGYGREEEGARPGLVYFFGGGWTLGNLDTGDAVCRALANAVPCTVVAVAYRLAPEHPFPAAVHDCYAGTRWVARHAAELGLDPERLAVGGDSAGGNLAAAVTLLARERGGPRLRHQLLVYPNTNYHADTASLRESEDPALFNRWSVDWYWGHYLADPRDGLDPLASPLRAPDLSALPAATVLTAEYDPLRDEGEQYAERLRAAGVEVGLRRFPGLTHGFFTMSGVLDAAREAVGYAARQLAAGLAAR